MAIPKKKKITIKFRLHLFTIFFKPIKIVTSEFCKKLNGAILHISKFKKKCDLRLVCGLEFQESILYIVRENEKS